jgi:hypothetical protein
MPEFPVTSVMESINKGHGLVLGSDFFVFEPKGSSNDGR